MKTKLHPLNITLAVIVALLAATVWYLARQIASRPTGIS